MDNSAVMEYTEIEFSSLIGSVTQTNRPERGTRRRIIVYGMHSGGGKLTNPSFHLPSCVSGVALCSQQARDEAKSLQALSV